VGVLAGAGGSDDVSAANASIGGCGLEMSGGRVRVGSLGLSEIVTEPLCRTLAAGVR